VTRKSSDSSRMLMKNQRLRKSSTFFIHFKSIKSLKGHVPPCVVLVINDNPYGLMFALSHICRTCL
jgi:hypothetical protein